MHPEGARSRAAAPLCRKEPAEAVRVSDKEASWAPPFGVILGKTNWEETPGQTQNSLEGLHVSFGLGTPQNPSGGCWKSLPGRGTSGTPCFACFHRDPTTDQRKENDRVDKLFFSATVSIKTSRRFPTAEKNLHFINVNNIYSKLLSILQATHRELRGEAGGSAGHFTPLSTQSLKWPYHLS